MYLKYYDGAILKFCMTGYPAMFIPIEFGCSFERDAKVELPRVNVPWNTAII